MAQIAENDILRALLKDRDISEGGVQSADPSRDAQDMKDEIELQRRVEAQLGDEPSFDQPFPQAPEFLRRAREIGVLDEDEHLGIQEALRFVLRDRVQARSDSLDRRPDNFESAREEVREEEAEHKDKIIEALLSGSAAKAHRDATRVYQ